MCRPEELDLGSRPDPAHAAHGAWATSRAASHDCVRHRCTTLFAALDATTVKAVGRRAKRHRHQEFLSFLRLIDRETAPDLDLHLVLDNYATQRDQVEVDGKSNEIGARS